MAIAAYGARKLDPPCDSECVTLTPGSPAAVDVCPRGARGAWNRLRRCPCTESVLGRHRQLRADVQRARRGRTRMHVPVSVPLSSPLRRTTCLRKCEWISLDAACVCANAGFQQTILACANTQCPGTGTIPTILKAQCPNASVVSGTHTYVPWDSSCDLKMKHSQQRPAINGTPYTKHTDHAPQSQRQSHRQRRRRRRRTRAPRQHRDDPVPPALAAPNAPTRLALR